MKLVVDHAGKFLVGVIVAAIILTFTATFLFPAIKDFVSTLYVDEQNFIEVDSDAAAPTITRANTSVSLPINEEVNIFSGITATSASGVDLMSQLTEDYAKPNVADREHVFVYKITYDGSGVLFSAIDTSAPGDWKVFFLVEDGGKTAVLEVDYHIG